MYHTRQTALKVLFIGGTGTVSSAYSQLTMERGIELTLVNRGRTPRPDPEGARIVPGDTGKRISVEHGPGDQAFDVVVDWIALCAGDSQ